MGAADPPAYGPAAEARERQLCHCRILPGGARSRVSPPLPRGPLFLRGPGRAGERTNFSSRASPARASRGPLARSCHLCRPDAMAYPGLCPRSPGVQVPTPFSGLAGQSQPCKGKLKGAQVGRPRIPPRPRHRPPDPDDGRHYPCPRGERSSSCGSWIQSPECPAWSHRL